MPSIDLTADAFQASPAVLKANLKRRMDLLEDRDRGGHTPLICAAAFGVHENLKILLDAGAKLEAKDKMGDTALIKAASDKGEGHTKCVQQLIEKGSKLNAVNNYGKTALIYASGGDHRVNTDAVKVLLEAGADYSIKCKKGKTALQWAKERGTEKDSDIVRVLEEFIQSKEAKGKNPVVAEDKENKENTGSSQSVGVKNKRNPDDSKDVTASEPAAKKRVTQEG